MAPAQATCGLPPIALVLGGWKPMLEGMAYNFGLEVCRAVSKMDGGPLYRYGTKLI